MTNYLDSVIFFLKNYKGEGKGKGLSTDIELNNKLNLTWYIILYTDPFNYIIRKTDVN